MYVSTWGGIDIPDIKSDDLLNEKKISMIMQQLQLIDRNIRFAMYNLDPEENFDKAALASYNGLKSEVKKLGKDGTEYRTLIEQTEEKIRLEAERASAAEGKLSAALEVTAEGIASKVSKDGIISAINQSAERVLIQAQKINLDGELTAGENFRLNINTNTKLYDVLGLNYKDEVHTLMTGIKPGDIAVHFDDIAASMSTDGFAFSKDDGTIDALYGKNAYTKGYGDFRGGIFVGSGSGLATRYGDNMLIQDYGNGNVASNAAGGTLLVGYKNTTGVQIIPEIHGNITITKDPSAAEYPDVEVWGNVVVHGTIYYDGLEQN
mgnify:FL=1|jgi:hypothetical protein